MSQKLESNVTTAPKIFQILGGISSQNPDYTLAGTVDSPGVEKPPRESPAVSSDGAVSPSLDEQIIAIEQKLESLKHKPMEMSPESLKFEVAVG